MFNSFSTALSALSANSAAVNIVGNNLANLNTTGYKANTFAFHDMVSDAIGANAPFTDVGIGVSALQSMRIFTQGSIQQTSGSLDAAISGEGFFVVKSVQDQTLYTRAGNFTLDATGHLLTTTNDYVQGWNAVDGVVNPNAAVSNIVLPVNAVSSAVATTQMAMSVNLDARGAVGATGGTYATPITVVDSQGSTHVLTVTYTKTDLNTWTYDVTVPDADLASPGGSLANGTLTFDANGKLANPAVTDPPISIQVPGLADGAADLDISWNLFNQNTGVPQITQFAQVSGVSATTQDGFQAGQIVKVGIADGGMIIAHYSNGQQIGIAQLALASIQNPDSMVSVGNNNLQVTSVTAAPAIGTAGSGGRGQINGHALETSTVDIAREFTNLITLQRSYQADSRVITTSDEMLQDVLNLKR